MHQFFHRNHFRNMKKLLISCVLLSGFAYGQEFTKQDTLKGSNTEFRNFWDVKKYELSVEPNFEKKSLSGSNRISLEITKNVTNPVFQIDLQQPMQVNKITCSFKTIDGYKRDGDFIFISSKGVFKKGQKLTIDIDYAGNPVVAKRAPWDGGWVFSRDENGNPWMTVAQEGIGTSVWLPVKDIWSDEPDQGIIMHIITPNDLVGVGNGRLLSRKTENGKNIFTWQVKNPINNYSIVPSIGKYVNFKETYSGEKGKLDLDYWVIDSNLEKAKKHFQIVHPMMKSFENWFGPYPFYEDSYKLVESPHLGMEHQSNVAYGNKYLNGYLGRDLSGTGFGLNWDFIIIHETGHEWFANNITASDQADLWIHEAFTTYSESLFTNDFTGKEAGDRYTQGLRGNIQNDIPIMGKYGVRNEGSSDMYPKGANMIHTIRQVINNDELFRQILRGMNRDFYHQTVNTEQVLNYFNAKAKFDFTSIFNQYLRTTQIPTLEFQQNGNELKFKWKNTVEKFNLPVRVKQGTQEITLSPTSAVQTIKLPSKVEIETNPNYYINYNNTIL